jgi:ParB-like chromosome segregation protein Spo0J
MADWTASSPVVGDIDGDWDCEVVQGNKRLLAWHQEAAGYRDLIERFGYSQEQVSEIIGKSRSHVANTMRLLKLPDGVRSGADSHGRHARRARRRRTRKCPRHLDRSSTCARSSLVQTRPIAGGREGAEDRKKIRTPRRSRRSLRIRSGWGRDQAWLGRDRKRSSV